MKNAKNKYVLMKKIIVHATTAKITVTKKYMHIWHVCMVMTNVQVRIIVTVCNWPIRFWIWEQRAIYAYILWSSSFSPLWHAWLPLSLKRTRLWRFLLSFGGLGHFAIMWSSDPHPKHFWGGRSEFMLDETSTARAFSFYFMILLKHFSAAWLLPPQNVHFAWS